jgi:hypothetical protein
MTHQEWITATIDKYNRGSPSVDYAKTAKDLRTTAGEILEEAAKQEAKAAAQAVKDALIERTKKEEILAQTTAIILADLRRLMSSNAVHVSAQPSYADHREALNPLLKTYGYRLVLVGDKSSAAIVAL